MTVRRPEVLAPAGDREALEAAVRAGADAVYFGLQGFNARARATNFDANVLGDTLRWLHEHGARGYVTLNTLVFDEELASVEAAIRACAEAGVDAVIVQDLAVAKLVRAIAPALPIHASTQMTCTDAASVELAKELGASRVILARELSLDDIAKVRAGTDVEVEVFVHGALCISYSGQCLTSEAIGGRSANRGACAQACRLPYDLVVDGEKVDTGERAFLLSPEDLESSAHVRQLAELGVSSLKIEGRLKGPEYVGATTRLYRKAVDALDDEGAAPTEADRVAALQTFTRGSGPGFFPGVDHQRLVEGRACDHRGLEIGTLRGIDARHFRGRPALVVELAMDVARGDGVLAEGGFGGEGEIGGRVWSIAVGGREVEGASRGDTAHLWLGPDVALRADAIPAGRRVFRTSDPTNDKAILSSLASAPRRVRLDLRIAGRTGEPFVLEGTTETGAFARITGDATIEEAKKSPLDEAALREKLGKLGETPFVLGTLDLALPPGSIVPISSINRARRSLVEALAEASSRTHATTSTTFTDLLAAASPPSDREPAPPGLFVLCRRLDQAEAAVEAGAAGVYLDFLELTGTGDALRALRSKGAFVGVAPPRIRKPGEEKIDRYLRDLAPDALLVRGLGALRDDAGSGIQRIGDFSLNVTNRLAAAFVLSRDLAAFTPSFDLDAAQLARLLDSPFGPFAEVVVHHPMPLFHMEHCVIAALLSDGKDHRDCGRPCDRHEVSLRDRAGMVHPVEADVGCRNTVFHAAAQSAAGVVAAAKKAGVRRFRVELVREKAEDVARIVETYRRLLAGAIGPAEVFRTLGTEGGYGVVRGSLRVL